MSLVQAMNLRKMYQTDDVTVEAIRGVDFAIEPSSFVSFVGPSGSGKSTLLNMIGCLDPPTDGVLKVLDQDVSTLSKNESAKFRGAHIGFIFQDFNLIPVLTVAENVEYPLQMVQSWPAGERKNRVEQMLSAVGMKDQGNKYPRQISGGQKQRVAIARALVTRSKLVLADEPTANLDRETAMRIILLMKRMRDEFGTTFVFSTHDPKIVGNAETIFQVEDGILTEATN